jgi:hypothetical protein
LTAPTPNLKGTLGVISIAIAEVRGDILSLKVFEGTAPDNRGLTVKVADVSQEELVEAVKRMVLEILDVREIQNLQSRNLETWQHSVVAMTQQSYIFRGGNIEGVYEREKNHIRRTQ